MESTGPQSSPPAEPGHEILGHTADVGLRAWGPDLASVFEEAAVVGTIYEDQILSLALQGKDLRKLVIREVMTKPLPRIAHDAPVERVTHLLSHDSPAIFVVMSEGKYEILTKYDLMGTIAELMEQKR